MVAISLYRGNLHRVPDVPRRWIMPTPKISLKDFKSLLNRRSKALSLLRSSSDAAAAPTTSSNPNPNPNPIPIDNEITPIQPNSDAENPNIREDEEELNGGDCSEKPIDGSDDKKLAEGVHADGNLEDLNVEKPDKPSNPNPNPNIEITGKDDDALTNDKEKRKIEVEEKLKVLNEKKHNLVQVLKQILNVEEELKRRNSMQGMATRPSVPVQVDVTNDSGSITRHATPRLGSETNVGGDMEVGEAEDVSNHNVPSRYLHRMSSMSPSSESPLRRPPSIQHNAVPHPSRSGLGTSSSPSRFAPTVHQVHAANLPTVSLSGTNYVASSPSPAASGGTSAFRDTRHPSPWN